MEEIIYGRQPVVELLRAGRRKCSRLCIRRGTKSAPEMDDLFSLARECGVRIDNLDDAWFDRTLAGAHHQGVAVMCSAYPYASFDDVIGECKGRDDGDPPLWLLLDHIQDPQNLGSLLRTADAMGVHGVVIPKDRAVGVTPTVVRVSAGASEHVSVCMETNLVRSMEVLKEEGIWLSGLEACPEAKPYGEADLDGALGLVVGSEGKGLTRLVREACDFLVSIPLYGHVDSLNAAVAGAIALCEIRRRRGAVAGDGKE